jgi:FtsP/CotA-like multicopper oxidase with cupredoxin domain
MSPTLVTKATTVNRLLALVLSSATACFAASAQAAAPGINDSSFTLTAKPAYISQPDGNMVYSWGYGCTTPGTAHAFLPAGMPNANCPDMQIPGPTLIVTEGQVVSVTLTNNLPAPAGNTSILFPGFTLTSAAAASSQPASCSGTAAVPGVLTLEATHGCAVTYTFTAISPGTRAYYSGTQGDLQVEMGLYGSVIVLPNFTTNSAPTVAQCPAHNTAAGVATTGAGAGTTLSAGGENDWRLAHAAYHIAQSCYDREYLFQFSEMDPLIHSQADSQVASIAACVAAAVQGVTCPTSLTVATEPYHPAYFMINGRSMPDDMDPNYAQHYPHQPYNGNPHMHPGDLTLLRIVGTGRWQHPFHEHGNHVRILARDGNLLLSATDATKLAGPLLFTTTTTPGLAMDGIFYWSGKGLNWDAYGHNSLSGDPVATLACTPDANGYNTVNPLAINYYEWCADHNKALEAHPFGDVASGGPATLPDSNILTNGAWFGGSAYLGPNATVRATGPTGTTPPSGTIANPPGSEAGFAFMWHSHNEREITTNNIFPGGMLMMMLVDSREFPIDESL